MLVLVLVLGASLFTSGMIVKPTDPALGTVLEGAGLGTAIGGGLGTIAATSAVLGTTAGAATIGTAAAYGGSVGVVGGAVAARHHKLTN